MNSFPLLPTPPSGNGDAVLSTGYVNIDEMLGIGGLPRGKVVELYGPPDCGKTTLALNWAAAAQAQDATVVYVDVERKLRPGWAASCGVNLEELLLLTPDNGTQAMGMLESLLRSFTVDLAIVDSAAALISEEELEAAIEDTPMEMQSEFLSRSLRRLSGLAERGRCCLLFLNQMRMKDRNGMMESAAGGRALAIHSAIRIQLERGSGRQLALLTVKNKLWDPFLEAGLEIVGSQVRIVERKKPARSALTRHIGAVSGG